MRRDEGWGGESGEGGREDVAHWEFVDLQLGVSRTHALMQEHDLSGCSHGCVLLVVQRMTKEDPYTGPPPPTRSLDVT